MTDRTAIDPRPMVPSRREVLRWGVLSAGALAGMHAASPRCAFGSQSASPRAKRCILIWLDGGPSHLDMFDPKPDAPLEVRGPFRTIETDVAGVRISELLPQTAGMVSKLAILRSLTSTLGEHNLGSQYLLTGYKPSPALEYPSYGAMLAHLREQPRDLPDYIAIPDYNAAAGAGYLAARHRPFAVGGDPSRADFRVRDLELYMGLDEARLRRRRDMVRGFDELAATLDARPPGGDSLLEQAYRVITSPAARRAFDLAAEPPEVRARYGPRRIGQSCLLARRLVEADVPLVMITDRGWDTHDNLVNRLREGYTGGSVGLVPVLDQAYAALLADLEQRGLLAETLVILMGEFGRTPKVNTSGGRDHWPRVFSAVLAGAGIAGGQVIGASDAHGESPHERPVLPEQLARTIYTLLGINPDRILFTNDGRPVAVNQAAEALREIVG